MKNTYLLVLILAIISCEKTKKKENMSLFNVNKEFFGKTTDGDNVDQYTLKNSNGMEVSIISYGGIITSWKAKDREGNYRDIVLGFANLSDYETSSPYFGALIGRYGNRIREGKFSLDGVEYNLAVNNGENHLHGGLKGFDKVIWNVEEEVNDKSASLILRYTSPDMEEGYPGNLDVKVTYTLTIDDELRVRYEAETDKKTVVNLTQHSYFNLSAGLNRDILSHEITIDADSYLPVNQTLIPTGELTGVGGTPFDFRASKRIVDDINEEDIQLTFGNGYDHCWVLNKQDEGIRIVASAYDPISGRLLEVSSDQPGIQFYSGNFLDGTLESKDGGNYEFRSGFCLETQHYPNSPNQESFPSVILNPGEKYDTKTIFRFSTR
tara:strand:+ start:1833 stop:2972 length:1140 start_codon:yes stop_codon:yes gene_type:complete